MNYKEEDEALLLDMVCESNEEVRNSLYEKYEKMIKYIVKKYEPAAKKLGIDNNDLIQEANVGFTNALNDYRNEKEASLKTFIQVCISRRLNNYIRKNQSLKNKMVQESLSLEYEYLKEGLPLKEVLGSDELDPSKRFNEQENYVDILKKVEKNLSEFENIVFIHILKGLNYNEIANLLDKSPKQIDNTMQRLRSKLKNLLKEEKK